MNLDPIFASRRRKVVRGLWIGLVLGLFIVLLWTVNWFSQTRLAFNDVYYVTAPTEGSIVIVGLDNASLDVYGRSPLNWSRQLYAQLIDVLHSAGARVVAFDLLFDQPAEGDEALMAALERARSETPRMRVVMPLVGVEIASASDGEQVAYRTALFPIRPLIETSDYLAGVNSIPDIDGIVRRHISRIQLDETQPYLSFPLATYLAYLRIPASAISQVVTSQADQLVLPGERVLPVDENGLWLANYFGPPGVTFPMVSLRDVLEGTVDPAVFADKIVLVGLTSTGATDRYPIPARGGGRMMAGVEIQAHALESLLQNAALADQSRLSQIVMIVILSVGASVIYAQLRWQWMVVASIGLLLLWYTVAFLWFGVSYQKVNLFHSTLAIALPGLFNLGWLVTIEIARRRQTESMLSTVVEVSQQRLSLDKILPHLVEDVQQLLGATNVVISLRDSENRLPPVDYYYREPDSTRRAWFDALISRIQQGPPLDDTRLGIPIPLKGSRPGVIDDTRIAVPIRWQGRQLGVLVAEMPSPRQVRALNPLLLRTLTREFAPGLDNAILYSQTRRQYALLETVLAKSPVVILIVDGAGQLISCNDAARATFPLLVDGSANSLLSRLLEDCFTNPDAQARFQQAFTQRQSFSDDVRVADKSYHLETAPLPGVGDWVVVMSDISTLVELNDLKSRMIRMAAHDLKNPLARIMGYVYLLQTGETALADRDLRFLGNIESSSKQMEAIITDVLDLEQLRSNVSDKREQVDFSRLAREMAERHQPDFLLRHQDFQIEIVNNLPPITGSAMQLGQAISNLLTNASKYTPEQGRITLRLHQAGSMLRLEVEDTGYGIPAAYQDRLFKEFSRIRTDATAHIAGTGLGLSLVKTIVEAHDGRIGVRSTEGVGSLFYLELPLQPVGQMNGDTR